MGMSEPQLVGRDHVVQSLSQALSYGETGLSTVPKLIKRCLREECWRDRVLERTGERVKFDRFEEFVRTPPLEGLGADVDLVKRIVKDDKEALDLLDQAMQTKPGRPAKAEEETLDNVQGFPSGNSESAALRRLRKDRPDLLARVIEGEVSAHAAMVAAGFRPKTITIRLDVQHAAKTLVRHFSSDELRELRKLLRVSA
jgi:hypothetical protein